MPNERSDIKVRRQGQTSRSDIEDFVHSGRLLRLQQRNRDVMNRYAAGGFALQRAVMSVAMDDQVSAMTIDNFREPRCT
jgi:hypothetical protein